MSPPDVMTGWDAWNLVATVLSGSLLLMSAVALVHASPQLRSFLQRLTSTRQRRSLMRSDPRVLDGGTPLRKRGARPVAV